MKNTSVVAVGAGVGRSRCTVIGDPTGKGVERGRIMAAKLAPKSGRTPRDSKSRVFTSG